MSEWKSNDPAVRDNATYKFCQMLDQDPQLREDCKNKDLKAAWQALRDAGDFEDMPPDVDVRVFEETIDSNDILVTMIIPKQGEVPPTPEGFEPKKVWRCTWSHYLQLKDKTSEQSTRPR